MLCVDWVASRYPRKTPKGSPQGVPRDGVMALGARHASLFLHPRRKHDVSCNFAFTAMLYQCKSLLFLNFQPSGVYFCA